MRFLDTRLSKRVENTTGTSLPFMNISTSDVSYPLDVFATVISVAPNAWRSDAATMLAY